MVSVDRVCYNAILWLSIMQRSWHITLILAELRAALLVLFFSGADFWIFHPAGVIHCFVLPNFTLIGSELWVFMAPKLWKLVILPIAWFLKNVHTTQFMRVLWLHSAKFGYFSSTNKKTKQLTSMGAFSAKFSMASITAKLLVGSENVDDMNVLYHLAKFGGNRTTHVGVFVCYWLSVTLLPVDGFRKGYTLPVFTGREHGPWTRVVSK